MRDISVKDKNVGIICEYNPIHSGHIYQIKTLRDSGAKTIICLMSGNFTQRGEFALADKYVRAESALMCGADLVLELPFPYCCASADYFARAGVYILEALSADTLCFGSERAELCDLYSMAEIVDSEKFKRDYQNNVKGSVGMAKAYFDTLEKTLKNGSGQLLSNDILALAYVKAIIKGQCDIEPYIIHRQGSEYNCENLPNNNGEYASATALRKIIVSEGVLALRDKDYMTGEVMELYGRVENGEYGYADIKNIERAILLFFRQNGESLTKSGVQNLYGGLIGRICKGAQWAKTYDELVCSVSTKKYTDSAVRRAIIYCLCKVEPKDLKNPPAYVNLLATNKRGREYLSEVRGKTGIAVITKPADFASLDSLYAKRQAEVASQCDALYTLSFQNPADSDLYIKKHPIIKK